MMKWLLSVALVLLSGASALALDYWTKCPGDKPWHALFRDGVQQGIWKADESQYLPYNAQTGSWGQPTMEPPVEIPESLRPKMPTGVIPWKAHNSGVHLNGRPVTVDDALRRLAEADLPNDKDWLWVTVIGPETERQQVVKDFQSHPALSSYKDRVRLQDYDPSSWAVSQGFVTTGHPTIYYQMPDGKTLGRESSYRGAEATAQTLDRYLRRPKPNNDPNKDPDPTKPADGDKLLPRLDVTWDQARPYILGLLGGLSALLAGNLGGNKSDDE